MPQFTVTKILDALKDVKVDDKPFISDALRDAILKDTRAAQLIISSETWESQKLGRFADVKTSSQLIDLIAGIYTNYFVRTEPFCNEQTLIENLLTKQGFHRKNGTEKRYKELFAEKAAGQSLSSNNIGDIKEFVQNLIIATRSSLKGGNALPSSKDDNIKQEPVETISQRIMALIEQKGPYKLGRTGLNFFKLRGTKITLRDNNHWPSTTKRVIVPNRIAEIYNTCQQHKHDDTTLINEISDIIKGINLDDTRDDDTQTVYNLIENMLKSQTLGNDNIFNL